MDFKDKELGKQGKLNLWDSTGTRLMRSQVSSG